VSEGIASVSFRALGTTAVVAAGDPDALHRARRAVERELAEIDAACSRFRADSELVLLNRSAGSDVRVSRRLLSAVQTALEVAAMTDGLVDPTIGRTLRLAGYDRTFEELRARDTRYVRAAFAEVPGWRTIRLDERRRTIRVPPGVELDLGATAKAAGADQAAVAAADAAAAGVLVSLGGDIAVAGDAPAGGWPIRIADDHAAALDSPGPVVSIAGGGLASSGTYVRRWTTAGGEAHHVVDPRTARPAVTPWRTVSVAAACCVDANAATTASIVLGWQAPRWLRERRLPARLVAGDGSIITVAGWPREAP
jgi:thiamine biosynthesis lipoprotein